MGGNSFVRDHLPFTVITVQESSHAQWDEQNSLNEMTNGSHIEKRLMEITMI